MDLWNVERLVSFVQWPGIDFNDTYAPVARLNSLRLLIALSVEYDMHIEQLDVTSAFLNDEIDTEIYMKQPELLDEIRRIIREETDIKLVTKGDDYDQRSKRTR